MTLYDFECVAPEEHVLGHSDQCLKRIRKIVYVTICTRHSGGPASPHELSCFWPYDLAMGESRLDHEA